MNKAEIMTKKHDKKCPLAPRLRFPEFRDAGEWHSQPLGELAFIIKEKAGDRKCVLMSIKAGVGLIPQIDKFGKEIAGQQYKKYIILHKNDFAYNKSSTKEYPEGFIAMYAGSEIAAVPNSIFTCFRIKVDNISHQYLNYLFSYNFHGKYLRRYVTVGARAHGALAIDDADLLSLPIPYPMANSSFHEQQRIADCLSSLDARIAAEADKLETLKEHKKGLLKQLFPAEGETTPKLRFPEFQNAGEWEEQEVGEVFKITRGEVLAMSLVSEERTGENLYPVYSSQTKNNGLCGFYKSYLYENAITWTTDGANAGDVKYRGGKFFCTNVCGVLINTNGYANICIAEIINNVSRNYVSYVGNPKLMNGVMGKIKIFFPSIEEQQRIADILASIDELISAQSQKIDLLKEHKKGLMQQLFPCVDEVQA